MKVLWLALLILCFSEAYANRFDSIGNTYEIAEKNALSWIKQRLIELEKSGELARQQENLKQQALFSIERPKRVEGLQKTNIPRTFEQDLTVTVPHDIQDHQGKLLHKAGTRVNPLQYFVTQKSLLFLDGEDEEQLAWAVAEQKKRPLAKWVLVNGSLAELSRGLSARLYFDQAGRLVKYFGIQQIPAMVEQRGDKLRITEIKL